MAGRKLESAIHVYLAVYTKRSYLYRMAVKFGVWGLIEMDFG